MTPSKETTLDYDRTVGTEERFAVRRFIDEFVSAVNTGDKEKYNPMISDAASIEGFSDFTALKEGYVDMLSRRFSGSKKDYLRFPLLKLSFHKGVYQLTGTYEEFLDDILVTEGTVEIFIISRDGQYQFAKIKLFPRMKLKED